MQNSLPNNSELIRLTPELNILPFDCGNVDLNNYLIDDAKPSLTELLATTFIIQDSTNTIAYFNYLNDKISYLDLDKNMPKWKERIANILPPGKDEYKSYPAVKIGRLGVSEQYKGRGIGRLILDYTKQLFIDNNRTGCKFITVDAYAESLEFYEKNEFNYLSSRDKKSDTRLMYYNLGRLA